jgi:hypothetical protein
MDKDIPSAFAGHAGEFFVLAELTRRGWTAGLTARNNRACNAAPGHLGWVKVSYNLAHYLCWGKFNGVSSSCPRVK